MKALRQRRLAVQQAERRLLHQQRIAALRIERARTRARQRLLAPAIVLIGVIAGGWLARGLRASRPPKHSIARQATAAPADRLLALVRLGMALWPLWRQWRQIGASGAPDAPPR
ncbi:MAG: hypothetical protein WCZ65_12640 [Lysobacteraceae bacterium]